MRGVAGKRESHLRVRQLSIHPNVSVSAASDMRIAVRGKRTVTPPCISIERGTQMFRLQPLLLSVSAAAVCGWPTLAENASERLQEATTVFDEIMTAPDQGIPENLLRDARCVVIIPGAKKAALVVGGSYGRGFVVCRKTNPPGWGAPAAVRMEGGSVGWQIGASETDIVMLVLNESGMERLLKSKFTLGGSASVAAGPVGRNASAATDARMTAKILAWSRTRGVFAGISLTGATLRNDLDENRELYGRRLTNKQIVLGNVAPPPAAGSLISALNRYSRREGESVPAAPEPGTNPF